jgi:predicted naringenin-chalcone synthase
MSLAIFGIGTAVPQNRYSQEEAAKWAMVATCQTEDQAESLSVIYRQTHIAHRHIIHNQDVLADFMNGTDNSASNFRPPTGPEDFGPDTRERMALYEREALPMAKRAAQLALDDSGVRPGDITHLITVSCTGFAAPGVDIGLIKELELPGTVQRTHIGFMGCHGAFNGLRVARAFAESASDARILLCATEICSIHYHYPWNPKRIVGNALFADGAAALVGVPDKQASEDAWRLVANGSCLFPDSEYAMNWTIGNNGFEMNLSAKVPYLIAANLRPWLETWLKTHGLAIGDIGSWAIHPGGPRIIGSVEEALGLVEGVAWASREVLTQFGNMSSPTVLFILDRLRRQGSPRPCVALGFGPGLVAEAALFY